MQRCGVWRPAGPPCRSILHDLRRSKAQTHDAAGHLESHFFLSVFLVKADADREEFQRNNRSRPWAEAYYVRPACYAYYGGGRENPHHWMLHEAVHQLNTEVAKYTLI